MHVFGAFELDIQPGTPDNPASIRVALLRYTRARTDACSSLRSAHPSRKGKDSSIPCKTSWTRSEKEPGERSRSPKTHAASDKAQ
jgi:hypothetical protein